MADLSQIGGPTLEEKVDACLILLLMLTSADGFSYNMKNFSPLWMRAMDAAQRLASDVSMRTASSLPECTDEQVFGFLDQIEKRARQRAAARELNHSQAQAEGPIPSRCMPYQASGGNNIVG